MGEFVLRLAAWMLLVSIAALAGCGGVPVSPLTNERRPVHLEQDPAKTLTVTAAGLEWYDKSRPAHGIRFAGGVYTLEAEDAEYYYLRSVSPLDFKEFKKDGKVETRHLAGGIMLGKVAFRSIPAAVYIDSEGASTKVLIWKLGSEFTQREGKDWKKSF
jgi:hypothetical protein